MQAADRSLSKLLNNTKDFFSVEAKTHKRYSKVGFMGKTAIDRGKELDVNGYVINRYSFNNYTINHQYRKLITSDENWANNAYEIIGLEDKASDIFFNKIKKDIENKCGYHVYYLSVTKGFHTLLLVINNSNPQRSRYNIYDQHFRTSSNGSLEDLMEGLRIQTSWTFANTCLNRFKRGTNQSWDATNTNLFKIQRK